MGTAKRRNRAFSIVQLDDLERRQMLSAMGADTGDHAVATVSDCGCMDHESHGATQGSAIDGATWTAIEASARQEWQEAIDAEATAMPMGEHDAVLKLVPLGRATHLAIRDGDWSDPDVWMSHAVPGAGANVWVMPGRTVTVDGVFDGAIRTVRVDGKLRFAADVNTALSVDTMVIGMGGELEIGTASAPISPDRYATITFADTGPIDREWDPYGLSRGLIAMGRVGVHGAETTGHVALAKAPRAQDTSLLLASAPTNWRVGDRIVLTGTSYGQDEVRTIRGISGSRVDVAPLAYNHLPPATADAAVAASLRVYVANLDRNVRLRSENAAVIGQRAHFMAMHANDVEIANAGFYGMGRTDKSKAVNDPVVDSSGRLAPGTGTNPRARYAVHFHRLGSTYQGDVATIRGSVVDGTPGWGIVNHSSRADVVGNTVYDAYGSAFATETGNETGAFRDNIAIRSTGSRESRTSRQSIGDFGFNGHGFWFQGPYVKVTGNVSSGHRDTAYTYYAEALVERGVQASFSSGLLADPAAAGGRATVPIGHLPMAEFSGNEAFASTDGLNIFFHNQEFHGQAIATSSVVNTTFWNLERQGAYVAYSRNITFRNFRVVGPSGAGINQDSSPESMVYEGLYLDGPGVGVQLPVYGVGRVVGGYFNNPSAALEIRQVTSLFTTGRSLAIDGAKFGPKSATRVRMIYAPGGIERNHAIGTFGHDRITLDGARLYFDQQHGDAVLNLPWLPASLQGRTNRQILAEYGIALGGAVAPGDAKRVAGIQGLVGGTPTAAATPQLAKVLVPKNAAPGYYTLHYDLSPGVRYYEPTPIALSPGWHLIRRTINGVQTTLMTYVG